MEVKFSERRASREKQPESELVPYDRSLPRVMSHPESLAMPALDPHGRVSGLLENEWGHLRGIARTVSFRVGARRHTEDVMQESAAAALRSAHQFRFGDHSGFRRWWAKIAHGIAVRFARHRSMPANPDPVRPNARKGTGEGKPEPPEPTKRLLPMREISLVEAIWNLEPTYREVILVRNYLTLDWDTIAAILHKPSAAAARQHYVRGVAALKRDLMAWMAQLSRN